MHREIANYIFIHYIVIAVSLGTTRLEIITFIIYRSWVLMAQVISSHSFLKLQSRQDRALYSC